MIHRHPHDQPETRLNPNLRLAVVAGAIGALAVLSPTAASAEDGSSATPTVTTSVEESPSASPTAVVSPQPSETAAPSHEPTTSPSAASPFPEASVTPEPTPIDDTNNVATPEPTPIDDDSNVLIPGEVSPTPVPTMHPETLPYTGPNPVTELGVPAGIAVIAAGAAAQFAGRRPRHDS